MEELVSVAPRSPRPAVVLSSSIQAGHSSPYGSSKLAAERALEAYAHRTGTRAVIYRLPGVFGKWCRPNYNSVVATFCHNIARDAPISISEPDRLISITHIDDVVAHFLSQLEIAGHGVTRAEVNPVLTITVGDLAERIRGFRAASRALLVPDVSDPLTRRLLGTYTSPYVPHGELSYPLPQRTDSRGE